MMRHHRFLAIVSLIGLAAPIPVRAQRLSPVQAAPQPAAQAAPAAGVEATNSLFDVAPKQFLFGARLSHLSGDPARYQRYQDLRDGVLFTGARYAREDPGGLWLFRASADNLGWRDQRFAATYDQPGRFVVSGLWDQIPQFYSIDTKTPYQSSVSPLPLDDATQRQIQNGQATLSAWAPLASQFELQERRDIGNLSLSAAPLPYLDVKAAFTSTKHSGELPWGASFGFGNDVEVALPYESRTNDFSIGTEWTNSRGMLRVAYNGSWFNNIEDTLVWDSPLRLDDSTSAPGRGQMALWPSNAAQTVSAAGHTKLAHRTQLSGFLSYGVWTNDEPLQPFTINATLPQLALPRVNSEARAHVTSMNLNLVSRPVTDWRFSARLRTYNYNNETSSATITQFVNYDTSITTSSTGGPRLYAHDRLTFDADATWSGIQPLALTVGYTRNGYGYDQRIFDNTGEDVFRATADAIGLQWVTFRANYEFAGRRGSGFKQELLTEVGEQPALRHYDLANRTRNRFTGQVDLVPDDMWMFSVSAGVGKDDYDDSYFGLQQSTFNVFSASADYRHPNGFGGGASYNYEHYAGLQQSRSASSGQENDPLRDWTADSTERVDYFSVYATPPRIGQNTEARLSYDYSYAQGEYLYGVVPGGALPTPQQLPKVYNRLQQLHLDVRHRLTNQLAATFSYLYEPFRVYDFAMDPSVVNGVVQPSSLVLGYVYRPYTANSFVFGLRYLW
jgi:MtrB/PioB family decaheme-associated outer membrane protein